MVKVVISVLALEIIVHPLGVELKRERRCVDSNTDGRGAERRLRQCGLIAGRDIGISRDACGDSAGERLACREFAALTADVRVLCRSVDGAVHARTATHKLHDSVMRFAAKSARISPAERAVSDLLVGEGAT